MLLEQNVITYIIGTTKKSKMKIYIFYPPLKEIKCNQSYCHKKHRLGVVCKKNTGPENYMQLTAQSSFLICAVPLRNPGFLR